VLHPSSRRRSAVVSAWSGRPSTACWELWESSRRRRTREPSPCAAAQRRAAEPQRAAATMRRSCTASRSAGCWLPGTAAALLRRAHAYVAFKIFPVTFLTDLFKIAFFNLFRRPRPARGALVGGEAAPLAAHVGCARGAQLGDSAWMHHFKQSGYPSTLFQHSFVGHLMVLYFDF